MVPLALLLLLFYLLVFSRRLRQLAVECCFLLCARCPSTALGRRRAGSLQLPIEDEAPQLKWNGRKPVRGPVPSTNLSWDAEPSNNLTSRGRAQVGFEVTPESSEVTPDILHCIKLPQRLARGGSSTRGGSSMKCDSYLSLKRSGSSGQCEMSGVEAHLSRKKSLKLVRHQSGSGLVEHLAVPPDPTFPAARKPSTHAAFAHLGKQHSKKDLPTLKHSDSSLQSMRI